MHKGYYSKLALTNMRNNRRFYIPYMITGIITVAMFYMMGAIAWNTDLMQKQGGQNLKNILNMGCYVIGIIASIFLFYTNSFLMKKRKKELGIYNILGMEKKHIAKILIIETAITAGICMIGGLLSGIIFDKFLTMLLLKIIGKSALFGFEINKKAFVISVILFIVVFSCTLIFNLFQVRLAKPVELLSGSNVGEKEPKTKIIMTITGLVCLLTGYYIAIVFESPLKVLKLFFLAVLLVVLGTYFLFTAGSIALLKLLRKNKKFYYKTKHFTAVSGMLYRMKQNAVGLANICILSTMVLITISTTVSLYIGIEDELNKRFPNEVEVTAYYDGNPTDRDEVQNTITDLLNQNGYKAEKINSYATLTYFAVRNGNEWLSDKPDVAYDGRATELIVMTREDAARLMDKDIQLPEIPEEEILVLGSKTPVDQTMKLCGLDLKISEQLNEKPQACSYFESYFDNLYYLVVKDQTMFNKIYQAQFKDKDKDEMNYYTQTMLDITFNIDGTDEDKINCSELLDQRLQDMNGQFSSISIESRQSSRQGFIEMYGGLLFLGMFLGTMFLMITVLIIFYKQISEGLDDKERYAIMQKVGMSKEEVKKSINSQIKIVFFLPIATAAIHIIVAFPMVTRLLAVLYLYNIKLFACCMLGTGIIFFLVYLLVFWITSKTYYKILGDNA